MVNSPRILQNMGIPTEWEADWSTSPFLCSDRGDFFRKLNCDTLGWCGLGGNNTLCLSSLLLLRSSKGFPDIISLLIIIPWHNRYQWVKWFSHNHLMAESGPGRGSPNFWSSLHHAPFRMVICFMEKRQLAITVVRVWDTCWGLLGEKLHLLLQAHEVDDAWTDYRGKLECGVTHPLEESGNQSGDIYECPSEICGDIGSLEQCGLTGSVSIALQ